MHFDSRQKNRSSTAWRADRCSGVGNTVRLKCAIVEDVMRNREKLPQFTAKTELDRSWNLGTNVAFPPKALPWFSWSISPAECTHIT